MNKWIDIRERLPEMSTSVLCLVKNHVDIICVVLTREYTTHDGIWDWLATFAFKPGKVGYEDCIFPHVPKDKITHWMTLPEYPHEI
jgi:hypothetical protein